MQCIDLGGASSRLSENTARSTRKLWVERYIFLIPHRDLPILGYVKQILHQITAGIYSLLPSCPVTYRISGIGPLRLHRTARCLDMFCKEPCLAWHYTRSLKDVFPLQYYQVSMSFRDKFNVSAELGLYFCWQESIYLDFCKLFLVLRMVVGTQSL